VRGLFAIAAVAAAVLFGGTSAAGAAVVTGAEDMWAPNHRVNSIAVSGNTAYIGGQFSHLAPFTGGSARFDSTTAAVDSGWPRVDGEVKALAGDGIGGWYLGGSFTAIDGAERHNLAHVKADGSLDAGFAPSTDGPVRALAVRPAPMPGATTIIVAGGNFSIADGAARGNLAEFNPSGALLGFAGSVSHSGSPSSLHGVNDLELSGGGLQPKVYVVGDFDQATDTSGPLARGNGAEFDLLTGDLQEWNPATNGAIQALSRSGTTYFLGGTFSKAGSDDHHGLAQVSNTTGAPTSWSAPACSACAAKALAVSGSTLYVAGNLSWTAGTSQGASALDVSTGALNGAWNPTPQATGSSIAVDGSTVYVGTNGELDRVDAATGAQTGFDPTMGGTVEAIGVDTGKVAAGGDFRLAGGVDRNGLAAIDLTTGRPTDFAPQLGIVPVVSAVAVDSDGLVWAAGDFDSGGDIRDFDGATGARADFSRSLHEVRQGRYSLIAAGSTIYVAGPFDKVGGERRINVAAVQNVPGAPGTVLPFDADPDGPVNALALSGDTLYLGGSFTKVNAGLASHIAQRHNLAAVEVTSGDALPWDPDADDDVEALAVAGDTVYAGGSFGKVAHGTASRQRLAAFEAGGSGAVRDWAPGAPAPVDALTVYGPTVFAGSYATSAIPEQPLVALDSTSGAANDSLFQFTSDGPGGGVQALGLTPTGRLAVGGMYTTHSPLPPSQDFSVFDLAPLPVPGGGGDPGDGGGTGDGGGSGGGSPDGGGPVVAPPPDVDHIAPAVTSVALSHKSFRVGRDSTASTGAATVAAAAKKKRKPPRGTTILIKLSEAARLRFEVLARTRGRKAGSKCVRQTRRNRKHRACTRLVGKGSFTRSAAKAGGAKVSWSGRIGRKALPAGSYTLRATPTDAAGNIGRPRAATFKIVR
jgi:trimeric autotransporter adhesin